MAEFDTAIVWREWTPWGDAFLWHPGLVWVHTLADSIISLSYFVMSLLMLCVIRKRPDLEFRGVFLLFSLFVLCGAISHLLAAVTLWRDVAGLHGVAKVLAAGTAATAAFLLIKHVKGILRFPSLVTYREALRNASDEEFRRGLLEIQRREEKIQQLSQDLSSTFEQAAVGIAHVGMDGSWLKANTKLCEILGWRLEQLREKTLQQITYEEDLGPGAELIRVLAEKEQESYSMEARLLRGDGELIWVQVTASVASYQGKDSHYIVVIEDISDKKLVQQALADSNAALERFAYSASHDLQEPLRKISSFSDMLQQRLKDQDMGGEAHYELNRIGDAAGRMRAMVDSLLQLSRYSQGAPCCEPVQLSELVSLIRDDLLELFTETGADLVLKGDLCLSVDKAGFLHVLHNLMTNSVRYAKPEEPARIVIEAHAHKGTHVLTVSDNGRGFDNQYAQNIFEPFRRLVSRSTPGQGMGLAICHQIIKAHKGTISAQGTLNQGAVFTIVLPAFEPLVENAPEGVNG
ncbi:PAS domain S-box protein [Aestuariicella hydrocarbonica]|uniref:histidine kinase n=1 Tax=Pseudomaricurvus hydrocarbonicus TaxID=1470433 RepID=A0A9E5JUZ4_9GAMM|nr:HAMP domain-containing sensor histidine kinase [Aestuariicella hydrocarbonica]NHO65055.1 PAS domain S-box protein [Aestuariicella hydrocarbonica]